VIVAIGAFQLVVNDAFSQPPPQAAPAQTVDPSQQAECQDPNADPEGCAPIEDDGSADEAIGRPAFPEVPTLSLNLSRYLGALATFMIAGSFIGAEFSSGSISNWLSFVPRRIPVFVSKLFTIGVFSAVWGR
jgi:ABC-2 type transport system permease protein